MIKEIIPKLEKNKTGFKFDSVVIKSKLVSPIINKIPLNKETKYFKEIFDKLELVELEKFSKTFKYADILPIYLWGSFFCVSSKFKKIFEPYLKGYWYLTNNKDYFIFLLDNNIDALNKEKTIIEYDYNNMDKPYRYKWIENETFKNEVEQEYMFTIPEFYAKYFVTSQFEKLYREHNLNGFQFFKNLNIRRKDGTEFDMFRRKKYDEEGNCLE